MLTVRIVSLYRFVVKWIITLINHSTTKPSGERHRTTKIRIRGQSHRRQSLFHWMVRRGRSMFRRKRSSLVVEGEEDCNAERFHEGTGSALLRNTIYVYAGYVLWKNRQKYYNMGKMEKLRFCVGTYVAYRQYLRRSVLVRRGGAAAVVRGPTRSQRRRLRQREEQQDRRDERRRRQWSDRETERYASDHLSGRAANVTTSKMRRSFLWDTTSTTTAGLSPPPRPPRGFRRLVRFRQ